LILKYHTFVLYNIRPTMDIQIINPEHCVIDGVLFSIDEARFLFPRCIPDHCIDTCFTINGITFVLFGGRLSCFNINMEPVFMCIIEDMSNISHIVYDYNNRFAVLIDGIVHVIYYHDEWKMGTYDKLPFSAIKMVDNIFLFYAPMSDSGEHGYVLLLLPNFDVFTVTATFADYDSAYALKNLDNQNHFNDYFYKYGDISCLDKYTIMVYQHDSKITLIYTTLQVDKKDLMVDFLGPAIINQLNENVFEASWYIDEARVMGGTVIYQDKMLHLINDILDNISLCIIEWKNVFELYESTYIIDVDDTDKLWLDVAKVVSKIMRLNSEYKFMFEIVTDDTVISYGSGTTRHVIETIIRQLDKSIININLKHASMVGKLIYFIIYSGASVNFLDPYFFLLLTEKLSKNKEMDYQYLVTYYRSESPELVDYLEEYIKNPEILPTIDEDMHNVYDYVEHVIANNLSPENKIVYQKIVDGFLHLFNRFANRDYICCLPISLWINMIIAPDIIHLNFNLPHEEIEYDKFPENIIFMEEFELILLATDFIVA
jgi:hypothetical protein